MRSLVSDIASGEAPDRTDTLPLLYPHEIGTEGSPVNRDDLPTRSFVGRKREVSWHQGVTGDLVRASDAATI